MFDFLLLVCLDHAIIFAAVHVTVALVYAIILFECMPANAANA